MVGSAVGLGKRERRLDDLDGLGGEFMVGGEGVELEDRGAEEFLAFFLDTGVRWRPDYLPSPRVEPGPAQERGSRSLNQAIDRLAAKLCYLGSWE